MSLRSRRTTPPLETTIMRTTFRKVIFCWVAAIGCVRGNRRAQLTPPAMSADEEAGRLRVMHVGLVAADVLAVALRAGRIEHGSQQPYQKQDGDEIRREGHQRWLYRKGRWAGSLVGREEKIYMSADRYVGDRLDADWAAKPVSFQLASTDDPRCQPTVQPKAVWRKTKPCDIGRVGPRHPWEFDCPTESVIYLELRLRWPEGRHYELRFRGRSLSPVALTLDAARLAKRGRACLAHRLSSGRSSQARVSLLLARQRWSATLSGRIALRRGPHDGRQGGRHRAAPACRKPLPTRRRTPTTATTTEPTCSNWTSPSSANPANTWWPSRAWAVLIRLRLPSESGEMRSLFPHKGFYHQRSGIALGPPYTQFVRPRPFHPDDGVIVRASTCPLMNSGNGLNYLGTDKDNFGNLVKGRTDAVVPTPGADIWMPEIGTAGSSTWSSPATCWNSPRFFPTRFAAETEHARVRQRPPRHRVGSPVQPRLLPADADGRRRHPRRDRVVGASARGRGFLARVSRSTGLCAGCLVESLVRGGRGTGGPRPSRDPTPT